jgi:hypothetical protein
MGSTVSFLWASVLLHGLDQRFPNFFQVGTTFISQNVLRTTLLLSPFKANCLRFSTTVCDKQFTLILFFLSFFGLFWAEPQFGKRWLRRFVTGLSPQKPGFSLRLVHAGFVV